MRDEPKRDNQTFTVVVNHEGQYSIWPADRAIPLGWDDTGSSGTKEQCLAHIEEVWTDMTPKCVRPAQEPTTASGDRP